MSKKLVKKSIVLKKAINSFKNDTNNLTVSMDFVDEMRNYSDVMTWLTSIQRRIPRMIANLNIINDCDSEFNFKNKNNLIIDDEALKDEKALKEDEIKIEALKCYDKEEEKDYIIKTNNDIEMIYNGMNFTSKIMEMRIKKYKVLFDVSFLDISKIYSYSDNQVISRLEEMKITFEKLINDLIVYYPNSWETGDNQLEFLRCSLFLAIYNTASTLIIYFNPNRLSHSSQDINCVNSLSKYYKYQLEMYSVLLTSYYANFVDSTNLIGGECIHTYDNSITVELNEKGKNIYEKMNFAGFNMSTEKINVIKYLANKGFDNFRFKIYAYDTPSTIKIIKQIEEYGCDINNHTCITSPLICCAVNNYYIGLKYDKLECPICDSSEELIVSPCCGGLLCQTCFKKWLPKKSCALCKTKLSYYGDYELEFTRRGFLHLTVCCRKLFRDFEMCSKINNEGSYKCPKCNDNYLVVMKPPIEIVLIVESYLKMRNTNYFYYRGVQLTRKELGLFKN